MICHGSDNLRYRFDDLETIKKAGELSEFRSDICVFVRDQEETSTDYVPNQSFSLYFNPPARIGRLWRLKEKDIVNVQWGALMT